MKNKFIVANIENIEKNKEKYFLKTLNAIKEKNKPLYDSGLMEEPTDEELAKRLDVLFNTEKMSKHQTIVPNTNIDFYEYISEIQNEEIENELIVLLDEQKRPFSSKIVNSGNEISVGDLNKPGHAIWSYVLNNPKTKFIIYVHNHPHTVSVFPSYSDKIQTLRHKMLGNLLNVELLDSCIISEFDFFSQYQYEQTNKNKQLLNYKIEKDVEEKLKEQNKTVGLFLKQIIEG